MRRASLRGLALSDSSIEDFERTLNEEAEADCGKSLRSQEYESDTDELADVKSSRDYWDPINVKNTSNFGRAVVI